MFKKIRKFNDGLVWFGVLFGVGLVMLPLAVNAEVATIYLLPSTGTYKIGNTFSIEIKVNSGGALINAAEGSLIFDTSELEVIKFSKQDSIFVLWPVEPTFSNSTGIIEFGGGTKDSFAGIAGNILTVTFRALKNASASVTFLSGSVLVADGKGTNILANMYGGIYTLSLEIITPLGEELPTVPIVSSPTHSEPEKWYPNNNPEFSWELSPDIIGVSLLLHKNSTANPGPISDGLIESKKYENLEDGIWYFHIKFRNQYGWGTILHRKVLVDVTPPKSFEIKVQRENSLDSEPILDFETTDETSGIDYYGIKTNEGESLLVEEPRIQLFLQGSGEHLIEINAFDNGGSYTTALAKIEVSQLAPSLNFSKIAINYLTVIITLIVLFIAAIGIIFYGWYRISLWRKRLKVETKEVARAVYRAFKLLREEIQEQIETFDKKPGLTKEEKKIRDKLQKTLNISKQFITKEIKDIEKELE